MEVDLRVATAIHYKTTSSKSTLFKRVKGSWNFSRWSVWILLVALDAKRWTRRGKSLGSCLKAATSPFEKALVLRNHTFYGFYPIRNQ